MPPVAAPAHAIQQAVVDAKIWTGPWTTAIYGIISDDEGTLVGSATYVRVREALWLLTAAHVVDQGLATYGRVARRGPDGVVEVGAWSRSDEALDLAVAYLGTDSSISALDLCAVAATFADVDSHHLFIHGFPSERSRFSGLAGGVVSSSVPYLTYSHRTVWDGFDGRLHFAIEYPAPEHQQLDERGRPISLPPPDGMSGCAVYGLGSDLAAGWSASGSRLIGVAHRWDQAEQAIVATRTEHILTFMLHCVREREAYLMWRARGSPPGDELSDWVRAERAIPSLT